MEDIKVITVPVKNVHPNGFNPRHEAGDVSELAASIKVHGILTNILVRPAPEFGPDHYVIEDGYRRWVAARTFMEEIRVEVRALGDDDTPGSWESRAIVTSLVTTLHRKDLTAMEKARAYGRLRDEAAMSQAEIARMLGVDPGSVGRYLSLLELGPSFQKAVETGKVTVERAVEAVVRKRAVVRKAQGKKPVVVEWEPEHFDNRHPLARKAKTMCDAREHTNRRRYGKVACGQCWETVIRQDQNVVDRVEYKEAGLNVPFNPPIFLAGSEQHVNNHQEH